MMWLAFAVVLICMTVAHADGISGGVGSGTGGGISHRHRRRHKPSEQLAVATTEKTSAKRD
jgi:hypothetical protein